jgi:predicted dehydrogenase
MPAMVKTKNAILAGVASNDPKKRSDCQSRFEPKRVYESYQALVDDPGIQAVYIPLPNSLHKEWVMRCAEHGKHILCEKPVALNATEGREMFEACRANGVRLMEAFMYRYSPKIAKVQELLAGGVIGEIRSVSASFSFMLDREDDFRWNPQQGGGALYDVGCYPINLLGMLTDDIPEGIAVEALMHRGVDRSVQAVLRYKDMLAHIRGSFEACFENHAEIVGTKGVMEIPEPFLGKTRSIFVTTSEGRQSYRSGSSNPYIKELEAFGDWVLNGREPKFRMEETLRNMSVIDRVLEKIQA